MRLGISSYTYVWAVGVPGYPAPRAPLTAFELLERAARLGVRVLQIADNLPLHRLSRSELDRLLQNARRLDIEIELGTRGIEGGQLRTYLELAGRLESPILRTVIDYESHCSNAVKHGSQPTLDTVVQSVAGVVDELERAGVKLAIENHDRFNAAALVELLERVGSDHVGICFDTANSIGCLEGPELVLQTLGKRIINIHVKDFCVFRPPHNKGFVVEGRAAGRGQLDIPALLAQVEHRGIKANAILELWPPPQETLDASMQLEDQWAGESIRFLRQLITD